MIHCNTYSNILTILCLNFFFQIEFSSGNVVVSGNDLTSMLKINFSKETIP